MKRTRLEESPCPVARSLDIIGDWWSLLIVRDALSGVTRFGEFQKSLGIAKNMLATRLKLLVDEGILVLQPASDGSAWQEDGSWGRMRWWRNIRRWRSPLTQQIRYFENHLHKARQRSDYCLIYHCRTKVKNEKNNARIYTC